MMMRSLLLLLAAGAIAFGDFKVGSRIGDLTVKQNDQPVVISPSKAAATIVIFVSTQCPISNAYNQRMSKVFTDYKGKDVQFAFVNANANESQAEVEEHTASNKLSYRVYKDAG